MTLQDVVNEARRLSFEDQLELWGILGDMVGPPSNLPLTPAQERDLDMRIEEYYAGKAEMRPGEQVMARLREGL